MELQRRATLVAAHHPPHQGLEASWSATSTLSTNRDPPPVYARDCEPRGFRWIVVNDDEQSVLAFLRFGGDGEAPVAVLSNLTPVVRRDYRIGLPTIGRWVEAINTDARYSGLRRQQPGGRHGGPLSLHGLPASAALTLPPLATLFLICEAR